jgi:hypothetical protein
MGRWVSERVPGGVQMAQKVQNSPPAPTFEPIEPFEPRLELPKTPPAAQSDFERGRTAGPAAVVPAATTKPALAPATPVEAWRAGIARLYPGRAISHPTQQGWEIFLSDSRAFLASDWAERAAALGWSATQLFGCHRDRPLICNWWGALLLIAGGEILGMTNAITRIKTLRGTQQSLRRMEHPYDFIVPVWDVSL